MIELSNISKIFEMGDNKVRALDKINLSIEPGDFVAIMGPSGSGKSTLSQILGLLDTPTSGIYKLDGVNVSSLSEDELAELRRNKIGFIFQQFNLLPRYTAEENVALPLLYSKGEMDLIRAKEMLRKVGLAGREEHRPNQMSGGQQQRVAIARALINKPSIIFADEPTGNLDSKTEVEIIAILKELNDQGITIIMVTHEDEIANRAKRIIRVRDGMIVDDERLSPIKTISSTDHSFPKVEVSPKLSIPTLFEQGFRVLWANKIRTFLSILGILIGVASVVAMMAIGKGAQDSIQTQLKGLGSNLLVLRPGAMQFGGVRQDAGSRSILTTLDADDIQRTVKSVKALSPTVNGRGQVSFQNKNWSTYVYGTTPYYAQIRASVPEIGRYFNDDENHKRARVAVVGMTLIRELFGNQNPIGEQIKINKINFTVIGVLPEKGSNGFRDQDDAIMMPINTAMYRLYGKKNIDSIEMEISNQEEMAIAQEKILNLLFAKHKVPLSQRQDAFQIRNMSDIQTAMTESSKTMSVLLASIAAISLIVGGIGIMNIMLVSVTERTKEIGLRKAVGATRMNILLQFVSESIVISFIGGIAGIVVGYSITWAMTYIAGWTTSVSPYAVLLSFVFSTAIGLIFGIYPAKKASELHPIQALRFE